MSKKSRAREADKAATSAKASAANCVVPLGEPTASFARLGTLLASGIIVLAALAAYHNSFSGPFVFDDRSAITNNPTITHFGSALSPPSDAGVGGRPILNLTYALNYALGGMNVWGYHALNLLIHMLAGLTLFGSVRRTLLRPAFAGLRRAGFAATDPGAISQGLSPAEVLPLALAVAVLWVVYPLQTEAVTYISQRAESLMGLFYLLTLYCFIRGADATGEGRGARGKRPEASALTLNSQLSTLSSGLWFSGSILACLFGVMSKETIVTVPVIVLLYDRTFVAGSFREAWRLRWRYYLGLAGTWLLLAHLMTGLTQRGVGFDQKATWWSYALTSCRTVVLYLKLALWPHPLVFDYGTNIVHHLITVLPYMLLLVVLVASVVIALWRWPIIGFAGAWFFVILAPTSSVVPIVHQPMADHRVYLSLAMVIGLAVLGLYAWIGRPSLLVFAAAAMGLGWLTVQRNEDYRSELAIWSDTIVKCPNNERAHGNLGYVLSKIPGRLDDAMAEYRTALRINPDFSDAHNNLGNALLRIPGRLPDAMAEFETALHLQPDFAEAHFSLGNALMQIPGRLPDAISEFETAVRIKPHYAEAQNNLGGALTNFPGRQLDAVTHLEEAVWIKPDYLEAHENLATVLAGIPGREADAISEYESALRIKPDSAEVHVSLGVLLSKTPGRLFDAITEYEAALRINPNFQQAHTDLGIILENIPGRLPEAISHFEAALQLAPASPGASENLSKARQLLEESQAAPH